MAMGKKPAPRQPSPMWVTTADLPTSAGHPFFERLNRVLEEAGFDAFVEGLCAVFYADRLGRPSLRPGRYFRLLFIGYFEDLSSERGIAWRVADSQSLRAFLDLGRDRGDAEPLDAVAHAASDRRGNARGGVHVGAGTVGGSGSGEGEDGRRRCDDAGSERGDADPSQASPTSRPCASGALARQPQRPASRTASIAVFGRLKLASSNICAWASGCRQSRGDAS